MAALGDLGFASPHGRAVYVLTIPNPAMGTTNFGRVLSYNDRAATGGAPVERVSALFLDAGRIKSGSTPPINSKLIAYDGIVADDTGELLAADG